MEKRVRGEYPADGWFRPLDHANMILQPTPRDLSGRIVQPITGYGHTSEYYGRFAPTNRVPLVSVHRPGSLILLRRPPRLRSP